MTTSRKSTLLFTFATLFSLAAFTLPGTASADSAAGDFSPTSNPNGDWSYGWSYGVGSTFHLDTSNATAYGGVALGGWLGNVDLPFGNGYPYVMHNATANPVTLTAHTVYQPGELALQTGASNEVAIIRWTAPSSGVFSIAATFLGVSTLGDSADVHILLNGVSLLNTNVTGSPSPVSYSVSTNISARATIDFIVGNGGNGFNEDTTALTAIIIPEPATMGLVLLSVASFLSFRFFKRK